MTLNEKPANINTPILPNCYITIEASTVGEDATYTVEQLEEYKDATISFLVNGKVITCPRFVEVNGVLEAPSYVIQENDRIETRSFYTLGQLAEFMDVEVDEDKEMLVNNREATMETLVYENFEVEWTVVPYATAKMSESGNASGLGAQGTQETQEKSAAASVTENVVQNSTPDRTDNVGNSTDAASQKDAAKKDSLTSEQVDLLKEAAAQRETTTFPKMVLFVNEKPVILEGKAAYRFVDLFDFIDFDLSQSGGRAIVTKRNGKDVQYTELLQENDHIEIYWEEKNR